MSKFAPAPRLSILPYRKPNDGRDDWASDDALAAPLEVRRRSLARTDCIEGYPRRPDSWRGMRILPGLEPDELETIEALVHTATGSECLRVATAPDGSHLNHNCIQVAGEDQGEARPHTDSRALCPYAAMPYLNPAATAVLFGMGRP